MAATASHPSRTTARLLNRLADPRQAGPRVSPAAICPDNLTLRRHCGPSSSPLRGCHTLARPNLSGPRPYCLSPSPLIPCLTSTPASLRWIRANDAAGGSRRSTGQPVFLNGTDCPESPPQSRADGLRHRLGTIPHHHSGFRHSASPPEPLTPLLVEGSPSLRLRQIIVEQAAPRPELNPVVHLNQADQQTRPAHPHGHRCRVTQLAGILPFQCAKNVAPRVVSTPLLNSTAFQFSMFPTQPEHHLRRLETRYRH